MKATISHRNVDIRFTSKAKTMLEKSHSPLFIDMELFFSCMIRKRVLFSEEIPDRAVKVTDKLYIGFHPVMTQSCSITSFTDKPPLTDFPIKRPDGFIPHWVEIDFKRGKWSGDFGYV